MDFFTWLFSPAPVSDSVSDSDSDSNSSQNSVAVTERRNVHGINIDGDSEFRERIEQALGLLANRSPSDLYAIQQYTRNIAFKSLTGAYYWDFTIGIAQDALSYNLPYLASILVHENSHNRLYRISGIHENSAQEELECIAIQIQSLRNTGGSSWEIRYLESLDGTHYLHSRT